MSAIEPRSCHDQRCDVRAPHGGDDTATIRRNRDSRRPTGSGATSLACRLIAMLLWVTTPALATSDDPKPGRQHAPEQVVEIVIEALRENDTDGDNAGIATVYRFASPENRQQTGPLERFSRMIRSGYGDMLNHLSSRRDAMEISDGVALQAVWLTGVDGGETGYMFRLGKQSSGRFAGMWMTDAVYPLGPGKQGQVI